jgi:hypothetical protein
MMKRAGDLKVGIHQIGDIVDSLDWQNGKLREKVSAESEGEEEEDRDDSDGEYERSPPLFGVAKAGG